MVKSFNSLRLLQILLTKAKEEAEKLFQFFTIASNRWQIYVSNTVGAFQFFTIASADYVISLKTARILRLSILYDCFAEGEYGLVRGGLAMLSILYDCFVP